MSLKCQRCNNKRIISVSAKCSDSCYCRINEHDLDDYVPQDVVFGEDGCGDYVQFDLCLDCGQMQGKFPNKEMALERGEREE